MNSVLKKLSDPTRSGVYRAGSAAAIREATRGTALDVVCIDLGAAGAKPGLLDAFARALAFPAWFGGNWDALEDCLSDLSWRQGGGHVLLIEGAGGVPQDDLGVLVDILGACADSWAARGRPFFCVFVGAKVRRDLPELVPPGA